ncbi:RING finger protein 151-like [Gigantopelta aegis]|uniref:RING finger protein 151-like n=1 Tax=Gigantopelta aegis TaxID=1735272 RepID=UPI001B88C355|nr:RING finger protein 151-like [Gigantopelta aegis]XP_041363866.1 RING finger protein 151-like [Gigantopelta aegis]
MPKHKTGESGKELFVDESPRYFLNPDSVSRHLYCSICQDVFAEPQRAPCGHSFCKKCILPWLRHSKTCPEDRKSLHANELHHDFILENIIGDQMVACSFRLSGCEFVGQLQQLSNHQRKCDFNPRNVPDFILKSSSPHVEEENMQLDETVPSPGKPSLMMRLFRSGDSQKKLLHAMFDDKENHT